MAEKKALPKSEWCFQKINPADVKLAFFYEYSRQSSRMIRKVRHYRDLHPYLYTFRPIPVCIDGNKYQACTLPQRYIIDLLMATFKEDAYSHLIDWLSFIPKFPEVPFCELEKKDLQNGRNLPTNTRGVSDIVWHTSKGASHIPMIFRTPEKFSDIISKPGFVRDHESLHVMIINWRKTDSELVDDFRDWLKMSREFIEIPPVRESARGIANNPLDLPEECKSVETALLHLGKLRCLDSCGSWDEYMRIYRPGNTDRRSLQKDVAAARKVVAWLESKI